MRIVIFGGTGRARELATTLVHEGHLVMTSLAGRTVSRLTVAGRVRVGGFGGIDGLLVWLAEQNPDLVIDATHSFAATMSNRVAVACQQLQRRIARFELPSWHAMAESSSWQWVDSHLTAAAAAQRVAGSILLTVGRQPLSQYLALSDRHVVARVVDPPAVAVPPSWQVVQARGPFTFSDEARLFERYGINCVVSKDAGGQELDQKLQVAATVRATVIMIERPHVADVLTFNNSSDLTQWIDSIETKNS